MVDSKKDELVRFLQERRGASVMVVALRRIGCH